MLKFLVVLMLLKVAVEAAWDLPDCHAQEDCANCNCTGGGVCCFSSRGNSCYNPAAGERCLDEDPTKTLNPSGQSCHTDKDCPEGDKCCPIEGHGFCYTKEHPCPNRRN